MSDILKFDDLIKFYPDNEIVFDEIKEKLSSIVPFVGSGLSAFIYPTWENLLKKCSENLIIADKKCEIENLVNNKKYEEAAQMLEDTLTIVNFQSNLQHIIDEKILDNYKDLNKQAVYLLPMLFKNLVITTNFDKVLERVYEYNNSPFNIVATPEHEELFNRLISQDLDKGIYRFHGDIAEYSKLVLTEKQFNKWYNKNGQLVKDLKRCFANKNLLFLGCSLNFDRTMGILQTTVTSGVKHYAIIDCTYEERAKEIKRLGDSYIRALIYPKGKYEYVRIILEHLLELIDKKKYNNLEYYEQNSKIIDQNSLNRFQYDANLIDFVGRKSEMKQLEEFCNRKVGIFKWWAVTGEGGTGKSRLIYEFVNKMKKKIGLLLNVNL